MKQRLLLALLMLLTSAGFMKVDGQTIVLPKSETSEKVTLTFTGKFSASSYPIVYGTKDGTQVRLQPTGTPGNTVVYSLASSANVDTTYTFNNAYAAAWGEVGVTLDGKVNKFYMAQSDKFTPTITSLSFTNNTVLNYLNLEEASGLTSLNVSGNKELTEIVNLGKAVNLATLNAASCGFSTIDVQGLTKLSSVNLSDNKITAIYHLIDSKDNLTELYVAYNDLSSTWDLKAYTKLAKLDINGNKLQIVKVTDELLKSSDFNKGIQDFTTTALFSGIKANANLDITNSISNLNIAPDAFASAESWMKYNDQTQKYDIDASNEANTIIPKNLVVYRFFDKNKNNVYVDGKYECVLVSENGFRYRVHFTVEPAVVELTRSDLPNGAKIVAYNDASEEVFEKYGSNNNIVQGVTQGKNYVIKVDFSDAGGYELSKFILKGLDVIDGDLTTNSIKCRVAAKYISESDKDEEPSIDAEIVGKDCEVTYSSQVSDRGYFEVYTKDNEGNYTVEVANNAKLAYGTQIRVILSPKEDKYKPTLTINNNPIPLDELNQNGQWYADYTVTGGTLITASFGDKTSVTMGVLLNGKRLDAAGLSFTGLNVDIKGSNGKDITVNKAHPTVVLLPGGEYQLETKIAKSLGWYIENILVEGKALNVKHEVSGTNDVYRAEFKAPSVNSEICIIASQLVKDWTVKATNLDASVTASADLGTQTEIYDGATKSFAFETSPAGMESFVTVQYKKGTDDWTTDAPKSVGEYEVQLVANTELTKTAEMYGYLPLVTRTAKLVIKEAVPTFQSVPLVTIDEDGNYQITGNAKDVNGQDLEGSFDVTSPIPANTTTSHVVKFTFSPKDNTNYSDVNFVQEVKIGSDSDVKSQPVKVVAADGLSAIIKNADAVLCGAQGEYVEGSKLYIYITYPQGVDPGKIISSVKSKAPASLVKASTRNSSSTVVYTYEVPATTKGEELTFTISDDAQLEKTYSVELSPKASIYKKTYTGCPMTLDDFGVTVNVKKEDNTPVGDYSISFKKSSGEKNNGFPVKVDTYDLVITVPAGDGHAEKIQEYPGCLVITKAVPTIPEWPTALPVLKDKILDLAFLSGGYSSDVAGSFQWADNVKNTIPEDGKSYEVWFVPTDRDNYEIVKTSGNDNVKVTVLDITVPILMIQTPMYGTITVTDSETGVEYRSGQDLTSVKGLVIKATPAQYFTFGSLTVNGTTYATQTVSLPLDGKTSVEVSALFNHIEPEEPEIPDPEIDPDSQYTITLPTSLVGAKLSKTGVYSVKRGGSFSFSVATLPADASKVVVKIGNVTIKPSSSGVYTLSDITSNYTVSVSLPNPTEIKLNVPTEYKNKGGYLMGRVQVQGPRSTGKFYYNDEVTLIAFPESGVKFAGWTGDVSGLTQVKEIVLTKDLTVKATFSGTPTGIEDIMAASITTGKGCVWVRGIANADVTIVSIAGRVQAQERISGDTRIDVPAGIYVVVLESGSDVKRVKVIVK